VHTSYFRNIKKLPKGKAIAICQGVPGWYKGERNLSLAPSWAMISLRDREEYDRQYAVILSKLDPVAEFKALEDAVGGNAILLCWESDRKDCHRLNVAEWFEKHLGVEVPEYPELQPGLEI